MLISYSLSPLTLLAASISALILYWFAHAVYVLYLHPLARFPGPKLWLLTQVPFVRALRRGQFIHRIRELHAQYGPIVRWAPNEVSYVSPEAWKDIYGHHGAGKDFPRNPLWYPRSQNGAHTILSADNVSHARIRKLLSRGFSETSLREQEPIIQEYMSMLVARLRAHAQAGRPVSIGDYIQFATVDIAGELIFGESFDCVANEEAHQWIKVTFGFFKRLIHGGSFVFLVPWIRPLLPYIIPKRVLEQAQQRFAFSSGKAGKRLELGENARHVDLVSHMFHNGKGLSRAEIDASADILISAGSETTATALTGILQYLLRTPATMSRLQDEIRGAIRTADALTLDNVNRLPYLTAVLHEGLRMCPPAPSIRPRLVPEGGAMVCGSWLPAGTSVGIPVWTALRYPANFGKPDTFLPERWLEASQGGVSVQPHNTNVFMPFSYGPRDCLGRRLGWAELRVILATLVWHFDMINRSPENRWEEQLEFVMWEKKPLMLQLTCRQ
ncbi:hypothetical protein PISL3812_00113 [Talaromyces islandicus]|uniref:Cytochrome P450 n=1 Tax=Talaromyces islandicus TaxID=28573 RepID=A0A0U1LIC7_TALIS|nr:hypothetical protein PISL3812_00113 [Talaromyces islandicus]